jgi:signal transduction histidine kinase
MNETRRPANILIIDDEEGLREMMFFTLEKEGYKTFTASNGEEGIQVLLNHDIDIIVTDIMMPGMDGIQVLSEVKKLKPKTEVIVTTGYGSMESAIECLRYGAYDFINKPYNIDEILNVIARAAESKQIKSELVDLKKLDKLKDELISMISHELRTPLTAVNGSLKLLMKDTDFDSGKRMELFEMMDRNLKKIRELIDSILDFSKMEAGFWALNKTRVKASFLVEDSIKQVKPLIDNSKIAIHHQERFSGERIASEDIEVECDTDLIGRVLLNFISNAIKYAGENSRIAVWYEKNGGLTRFVVEDNGKGLEKKDLNKVFEKFYRVDNSLAKVTKGTGLGLAICKKIIELHGGRIWAESEGVNKGSRFVFEISS